MSILKVENLSIQFTGSPKPTVNNISFSLEAGKVIALVGESGSGKSITALSLLGLNHSAHYPTGDIIFEGKSLLQNPNWQQIRGREISMVFQEPMSALNPLHNIYKQLSEIIRIHNPRITHDQCLHRIHELCDEVELSYLKTRLQDYPHQLSGGERQRVMLAMAIANHPKLLVADEPTTALDVSTQAKIMKLLQGLQQKYGMTLLLITHDLHLVNKIADEVMVMRNGEIVESGSVEQIFTSPSHPYTAQLLAATHGDPPPAPLSGAPILLKCNQLAIDYQISKGFFAKKSIKRAVQPLSLNLQKGETLGIVGESGSGKTSLGLAIARLIPSSGTIVFQGRELHNLSTKQLTKMRPNLQFVFQDPFASLNPRLNIEQIICEGLNIHFPDISRAEKTQRLNDILADVGLPLDIKNRYPHEFSGGQRQRINIVRAMILRPSCIIFDEPTSALDVTLQTQIIAMLKKVQLERQISYIFISHDIRSIKSISHKLMVLKQGIVVEAGATIEVMQAPVHEYTKMLIAASIY